MLSKELINTLGLVFICLFIFAGGFYFGYQYSTSQNSGFVATPEDIQNSVDSLEREEIVALEVEGVHWIKAGEEPICPQEYPIKGKLDTSVNVYYTKDNKFYNRVKPHLCFANEDFASEEAGFIKKF